MIFPKPIPISFLGLVLERDPAGKFWKRAPYPVQILDLLRQKIVVGKENMYVEKIHLVYKLLSNSKLR